MKIKSTKGFHKRPWYRSCGCVMPLGMAAMMTAAGCAVVSGSAGDSKYMGFAFGEKASTTLAGLNITETESVDGKPTLERGVGIETSGAAGEADVDKLLGNLLLLGLQSHGMPARPVATPPPAVDCTTGDCAETITVTPK